MGILAALLISFFVACLGGFMWDGLQRSELLLLWAYLGTRQFWFTKGVLFSPSLMNVYVTPGNLSRWELISSSACSDAVGEVGEQEQAALGSPDGPWAAVTAEAPRSFKVQQLPCPLSSSPPQRVLAWLKFSG